MAWKTETFWCNECGKRFEVKEWKKRPREVETCYQCRYDQWLETQSGVEQPTAEGE